MNNPRRGLTLMTDLGTGVQCYIKQSRHFQLIKMIVNSENDFLIIDPDHQHVD